MLTSAFPQTRAIDLPSNSNFAVAMRSQQEAERAEQQRIKRLVLNYDSARDEEDDATNGIYLSPLQPNPNHRHRSDYQVWDDAVLVRYI